MTIPYWKKEPISIPDEVGMVIDILKNPLLNHKLLHVVSPDNIIRKKPETFQELITIVVKKKTFASMVDNEPLPPDGNLGYSWESDIEIAIVGQKDGYLNYPPAPPGQPDSGTTRYEGAENFLNVVAWLVHTTLSENREQTSVVFPTFHLDDIQPVAYEYDDSGYEGTKDMWAIMLTYKMSFEMVVEE